MDDMNKRGKTPQEILAKLQAARDRKGESGPSKDGVYRFLSGHTYKRGGEGESRAAHPSSPSFGSGCERRATQVDPKSYQRPLGRLGRYPQGLEEYPP